MCFLQAEDGIRDLTVTGVQTCALPIYGGPGADLPAGHGPRTERRGRPRAVPSALRRRARSAAAAGGGPGGRGGAGDRERVGEGKRGDLGGRRINKKKKRNDARVRH